MQSGISQSQREILLSTEARNHLSCAILFIKN